LPKIPETPKTPETPESAEARETREARETQESAEAREARETKESAEAREARETQESAEARESAEAQQAQDPTPELEPGPGPMSEPGSRSESESGLGREPGPGPMSELGPGPRVGPGSESESKAGSRWKRKRSPKRKRKRPLRQRVQPRERIRVTREGWLFILICLAVGLAAIRSGNNLLFLILGMMLGLLVVSGILSELSLRRLEFNRSPAPTLHAAKPFLMSIAVTNSKRAIASFSIEVEDILGDRVLDKRCYFLKIPAGRTQSTAYRHAFPRRGIYRYSGFRISTKFPFALLRKSRVVELETEVVVLPSIHPVRLPPLPAPGATGEREQRVRGRGGDVYGLRDFRPGDDPRDVHWKSSAHRGRLVLRERQADVAQQVQLVLDHRLEISAHASLLSAAEGVERAITLTASLAAELIHRGYRVAIQGMGSSVPADGGPAHLARMLGYLARLPYADAEAPAPEPPVTSAPVLRVGRTGRVTLQASGPVARRLAPAELLGARPTVAPLEDWA
jgi:uncharacterized protein (DUF58 family)